ncbi:unnamed protein product, partial [Ectocarpus sp. 13 AM-2016]
FRPRRKIRVANCSQVHRRDGGRPTGRGQVRGGSASAAGGDPHHSRRAPSCQSGRPPPPGQPTTVSFTRARTSQGRGGRALKPGSR